MRCKKFLGLMFAGIAIISSVNFQNIQAQNSLDTMIKHAHNAGRALGAIVATLYGVRILFLYNAEYLTARCPFFSNQEKTNYIRFLNEKSIAQELACAARNSS